jgi:hypothetical protein
LATKTASRSGKDSLDQAIKKADFERALELARAAWEKSRAPALATLLSPSSVWQS